MGTQGTSRPFRANFAARANGPTLAIGKRREAKRGLTVFADLTTAVLALHALFIVWVALGAFWTRGRKWLTGLHLASLAWGILIELAPWPCPLTLLEQDFDARAGGAAYRGAFLLHYLQQFVYPNLSDREIVTGAVAVCVLNLGVYAYRAAAWTRLAQRRNTG